LVSTTLSVSGFIRSYISVLSASHRIFPNQSSYVSVLIKIIEVLLTCYIESILDIMKETIYLALSVDKIATVV
jgi:hypothetical protein